MTDEEFQKLQGTVDWARNRLDTMNALLSTLRTIETQHVDIVWGRKALSGEKLFEASCHLEREIAAFVSWLNNKVLYLNLAQRDRGITPTKLTP